MKKIILTSVLTICSTVTLTVDAQTKTSLGIKLNGNLTNVKIANLQGDDSSFKTGASIGGFTKIEFNENFALQPELLLNYTERKIKSGVEKVKFKYASVEVPVYAIGQFAAGNGKIFFGAGPHIGYGFSADSDTEKLPDCVDGTNKLELSHWYMGGGVIAGYEFNNGLILNAGYKLGYDISSKKKESGVDTQTFSLGIAYRF